MSLILVMIQSLYRDQSFVVNISKRISIIQSIFRKVYEPETSILLFLSNSCVTQCDRCVTQAVGKRLTVQIGEGSQLWWRNLSRNGNKKKSCQYRISLTKHRQSHLLLHHRLPTNSSPFAFSASTAVTSLPHPLTGS